MTLDTDFFRRVMGQFATGVTIATTHGQNGPSGVTVNSFTSVSLHPPLILICIDLNSQVLPLFRESRVFAVNILTQEQEALSNGFATHSQERYDHFCHASYHVAATGAPILEDTMGFLDARLTTEYPGGDHTILLGQIEAMGYNGQTLFLAGAEGQQSVTPALEIATGSTNNGNGHSEGNETPRSPLLYYRGKYHRLNTYQHAHPKITPTNKHG